MKTLDVTTDYTEWETLTSQQKTILDSALKFIFYDEKKKVLSSPDHSYNMKHSMSVLLGFYMSNLDFKRAMARIGIAGNGHIITRYYISKASTRCLAAASYCKQCNIKQTSSYQRYFQNKMYRYGKQILDFVEGL